MYHEIEKAISSIIKSDPISSIANIAAKDVAMAAHAYFHIDTKYIIRTKTVDIDNVKIAFVVHTDEKNHIGKDLVLINGKNVLMFLIPNDMISTDQENAIQLTKVVVSMVASCVEFVTNPYTSLYERFDGSSAIAVLSQAIVVITTFIISQFFSGQTLPLLIVESIRTNLKGYLPKAANEDWVTSILTMKEEDCTVKDILDDGFICSISPDNVNYPGVWNGLNNAIEEDCKNEPTD